jgi:hypothetical protein
MYRRMSAIEYDLQESGLDMMFNGLIGTSQCMGRKGGKLVSYCTVERIQYASTNVHRVDTYNLNVCNGHGTM